MPTILFPTNPNTLYFSMTDVYYRADNDTVNQYCAEKGYTLTSYKAEDQRFSNDGSRTYLYYDTTNSVWLTETGFAKVVSEILYS
jgi:hypothetical protein